MDNNKMIDYGIDREKGLKNCLGKPDFYKRILSMFLADSCFANARKALASGNQKVLFGYLHELKGTSGNAALPDLYAAIVPLVDLMRHGEADPELVNRMFAAVEEAYLRACEGIAILVSE